MRLQISFDNTQVKRVMLNKLVHQFDGIKIEYNARIRDTAWLTITSKNIFVISQDDRLTFHNFETNKDVRFFRKDGFQTLGIANI